MVNTYKDKMGRFRTKSLFLEIDYDYENALYTLKDADHTANGKTYISLSKAYVEMGDPTEYTFANKYFHSWAHWKKVKASPQLKPFIEEWQEELEVRLKSEGVRKMINVASGSNKDATAAAKWLSDKGWDKRPAGAPSTAEKARATKIAANVQSNVDEDWERINNPTVN